MTEPYKMKHSKEEKERVKKEYMVKQGFVCPICSETLRGIPLSKLALDHCHETGHVRGTLHMGCNRAEGVVLGAMKQWARRPSVKAQVEALLRLAEYWKESRANPSGIIYPTHKTEEQAKEAKLKKARLAARKRRLAGAKK